MPRSSKPGKSYLSPEVNDVAEGQYSGSMRTWTWQGKPFNFLILKYLHSSFASLKIQLSPPPRSCGKYP